MKIQKIIPYFMLLSGSIQAETTLLDFADLEQPGVDGSKWQYLEKNEPCFDWDSEQGKWCRDDGWRFFWYYSYYQTEHMGFTRFGHMLPNSPYAKSKSDLLVVGAGGAYRDELDQVQIAGTPIVDSEGLKSALTQPSVNDFPQPVPGSIALYYKHIDPLRRIPEFQQKTNRLRMTVWMPEDADAQERYRRSDRIVSTAMHKVALYPFINSGKSGHYYHHAMNRGYGQWVTIQFDAHPTHHNQPNQPPFGAYKEGGFDYPGDGAAYFAAMTSFSLEFYNAKNKPTPYMMMMGPWVSDYSPYENEETINNLSVGLDPKKKQFDISFEDKYRCEACKGIYEIRYSTKPITNENWNSASKVVKVENFFVEDDNSQQRLIKPSPYYTQVWGKFSINLIDFKANAINGRTIYFAVRDLSERNFAYDPDDDLFVQASPNGLRIPKRSMIKTIRYDFKESPNMPVVEKKSISMFKDDERIVKPTLQGTASRSVFSPTNTLGLNYNALTDSFSIRSGNALENSNGVLYGLNEQDWLSYWGDYSAKVVERDCLAGVYCTYKRLVEFSPSGVNFLTPNWTGVSMDSNSGFREAGVGLFSSIGAANQYVSVSGLPLVLSPVDVIELSITNTNAFAVFMPLYYSTSISGSKSGLNELEWMMTDAKNIPAKTTVNYYVKASELGFLLPMLTVNMPHPGVGVSLSSISVYTQL